jgi:tyrocidine synthetase-3
MLVDQPSKAIWWNNYFVQLADDVNLSALTAAFNVVIQRHPVLNSVYRSDEQNKAYQVQLGADIAIHMHVLTESHELLAELEKEISRPFDLTTEASNNIKSSC